VRLAPLALLGVALTAPAAAQQIQFSALLRGELGYGTNPFLRAGVNKGSGLISGSFAPRFFYETARSTTTLSGSYDRDQYFSGFGRTDSARVSLVRMDRLTEHLASTITAGFSTTNRATVSDPDADNEPLNIGRRTYRSNGQIQLQYQATAMDQFSGGAQINHLSYGNREGSIPGLASSAYTQYGGNFGYTRVIDARTSLGAQVTVSAVRSEFYPDSRTVQPAITAKRQLSAIWSIDGHVGLVLQHVSGPFANSVTSVGYGVNLCGTYPRTHICLNAQHQTSPSGYGSLRTVTGVGANLSHDLTEHSRISANAQYYKSSADQTLLGPSVISNSQAILTSVGYDRDLTQRLSAGFDGSYHWRKSDLRTQANGAGHAIGGRIHVTAKLGRI